MPIQPEPESPDTRVSLDAGMLPAVSASRCPATAPLRRKAGSRQDLDRSGQHWGVDYPWIDIIVSLKRLFMIAGLLVLRNATLSMPAVVVVMLLSVAGAAGWVGVVVTTPVGFASMNFSAVPPCRDLGDPVAAGTLLAGAGSLTLLGKHGSIRPQLRGHRSGDRARIER